MAILKEIRKTWPKEVTKMIKYKGYYRDFSLSEIIIYSDGEENPKKMLKQSIKNEYKEYLDKSISIEESLDMMDLENMMSILQTNSILYIIYYILFIYFLLEKSKQLETERLVNIHSIHFITDKDGNIAQDPETIIQSLDTDLTIIGDFYPRINSYWLNYYPEFPGYFHLSPNNIKGIYY